MPYLLARDLPPSFLLPLVSADRLVLATAERVAFGARVLVRVEGRRLLLRGSDRVMVAGKESEAK